MITVHNISIKKGNRAIVDEVSIQIPPGKFTAVLGMNGAGKSTLLKAINNQERIMQGYIEWDGVDLSLIDTKDLSYQRAVLSQNFAPGFPMKVMDLVEMGSYPFQHRISPDEKNMLVYDALKEVGMIAYADRDFSSLSGGEQKRILLAKCLVQLKNDLCTSPNKYLFLDEPTASIDIHHSYKILELVKNWTVQKNLGVFAILHDLNLASQFADNIVILKEGRVVQQGHPDLVFTPDHLEHSLEIKSIINQHPVFGCPHIITLPI